MGVRRGGEKESFHIKDKFLDDEKEPRISSRDIIMVLTQFQLMFQNRNLPEAGLSLVLPGQEMAFTLRVHIVSHPGTPS